MGQHLIKGWSTTQSVIALSSGEAELYALVKGAAQTLGIMAMAQDFGIEINGGIRSDSSAAIGITSRQGLGKLRHINVQYLWVQEKIKSNELKLDKVAGVDNPADLFTKYLDAETILKHLTCMNLVRTTDRAATAPTLALLKGYNMEPISARVADFEAGLRIPGTDSMALASSSALALGGNCYGGASGVNSADRTVEVPLKAAPNCQNMLKEKYMNCMSFKSTNRQLNTENMTEEDHKRCLHCKSMDYQFKTIADMLKEEDNKDDWNFEDNKCVRVHAEPRMHLFTPVGVSCSPPAQCIFSVRITEGAFCDDGREFTLVDSWRNRADSHASLGRPWIGRTQFYYRHPDHM